MSTNRCETICACELIELRAIFGRAAVDDPDLLTLEEWWPNCRYPHGYSYREDAIGNVYSWVKRGADGHVTTSCNSPQPGYEREISWTYAPPKPADRYRWKHIQCPLCRRHYAGWYVQQAASIDPPVYELYDTSYFYAYNDEPSAADLKDVVEWTPQMLAEAAALYLSQREKRA